jgi:hypothetical protein
MYIRGFCDFEEACGLNKVHIIGKSQADVVSVGQ